MNHLERVSPGSYKVVGAVNFDNAANVERLGRDLFQQDISTGQAIQVSFAELVHGDSAALAMILSWMRLNRAEGHFFCITDLPEELSALARVCGVETILQESACQI